MAALKRRTKKMTKAEVRRVSGTHYVVCKLCQLEEELVPLDIGAVTCARCVQGMITPPIENVRSGKPRGWHFKVYFEHDGVVYSKGDIVTDRKEIQRLKSLHMDDDS